MPDIANMTAKELRSAALAKDWEEYCKARVEKQKARIASYEAKAKDFAARAEEARAALAAAEADAKQPAPAGWKKPGADREGVIIGVPAAEMTAKGN